MLGALRRRWGSVPSRREPASPEGLIHPADLPTRPGPEGRAAAAAPRTTRPTPRQALSDRRLRPGDLELLGAVQAAQRTESHPRVTGAIYLMLATVVLATAWASLTHIEMVTRAEARVVPEGREQIVASLEGGILRELLVHDGDQVRRGQVLARLDPTRFESQQNEGEAKRLALLATQARLKAEASGRALVFPAELAEHPELQATEREAYQDRRQVLDEASAASRHSIALVRRELDMSEALSRKGLMSDVEVMRLRRQIGEMRQQADERRGRFRQEASTQLLQVQSELAQLAQQQVARDDAVRRTELVSPVDGLVKNIRTRTPGGVVAAGAPVLEIVPVGQRLLVEARIKPGEIGFVHVGQKAEIKLAAYDYNLYGGLEGTVENISPDVLGDAERANGGPDATWFRALVRVERSTLRGPDGTLAVQPGMTGSVEINTGQRTVLEFVLRPLLKAREAFRER
ncbi:HlyD family type I secretion periplasmic adaptor subunit [Ideonella oryzae]|uniref:Membrane fusion protein (MFP) family protein n=1 Tax=Ideonella oryzae TaxID=2937441 RepID=A0ABT1BT88_9BURK|nr:HlyD family type I secretion periplasmic adaptor subunit [Ideonella oryzae]MCO5979144.1 HlyD family type I secretion periplasmic adaptor subunit [Ideonella oryzae]